MSDEVFVRVEVSDRIATIRLDRAPVNALNASLRTQLTAAAAEVSERDDVGAVIVYGGPKHFAAGADIRELAAMSWQDMVAGVGTLQSDFGSLATVAKPTIAAVTGYALGGGLEVALSCDFRIAATTAKMGLPEIQLGIIPGGGGTQRLARLVGPSVAKDLIFSGRHVGAQEALAIGLVDEIVEPEGLYDAALARARVYAAGPALALKAAKQAVDLGMEVPLDTGLAIERQLFQSLFASDDRTIGVDSFLADGPGKATFTGR